jgi:hypothetical protein
MEVENKKDRDYFILVVLLMIAVAFLASFFRYYVNLDYDIFLTIECDPEISECVTDEESYYNRFLVKAKTIENHCGQNQNEECILDLYNIGEAEMIPCEQDLEEWEECVNFGTEDAENITE